MSRATNGSRAIRNIERMIAALSEPRQHGELMTLLCMCDRSTTRYLSHLRNAEPKRVFILRYDRVERGWSPVFALGSGEDAKRPKRQTNKQRSQIRRTKWRKNPDIHDAYKAKERARARIRKVVKQVPATWLSALTGA